MKRLASTLLMLSLAAPALAVTTGTELWIPAAFKGNGAGGSVWSTDVYIYNPQSTSVAVTVTLLARDTDSSIGPSADFTIQPDETAFLVDILGETFGLSSGGGAFLVEASEAVAVDARIFNRDGSATFGQGFEGVPSQLALIAGSRSSHRAAAIGGASGAVFRSNFYGVNTSSETTEVRIAVLDPAGNELGAKTYSLPPRAAILRNVTEILGGTVDELSVVFEVLSGSGIFGLSTVDGSTGDPTTHGMAAALPAGGVDLAAGGWIVGQVNFRLGGSTLLQVEDGAITRIVANHALFDSDGGTLAGCGQGMRWRVEGVDLAGELPVASDGSFSLDKLVTLDNDEFYQFRLVLEGQIDGGAVNGTWQYQDLRWGPSESDLCTGTSPEVSFVGVVSSVDLCAQAGADDFTCASARAAEGVELLPRLKPGR